MGKGDRQGKQVRHLKAEIKRLQAELKRLKNQPLDKDEENMPGNLVSSELHACFYCKNGMMAEIEIIGKRYLRCLDCGRTKKV